MRRQRDESGYAMLLVIASVLVMSIFAAGALSLSSARQKVARREQDFSGTYQAAMSGLDDYIARLQANPNYFTSGNTDPSNAAMSGYVNVPGSTSGAQFKYTVDSTNTLTTGVIAVTATGIVNGKTRKLFAKLAKLSFLNYMYFTQYETIDPVAYASPPASGTCDKYTWASPTRPLPNQNQSYCSPIYFGSSDTLRGPVYSQDTMQFSGSPAFTQGFKTGWSDPAKKYWACASQATCNPTFNAPPTSGWVPFPTTNLALRASADKAQGGGGCIFKGPTSIFMHPDATMTVISNGTPSGTDTGACGIHNWSGTGFTLPVPTGQVIWIDAAGSCATLPGYPVTGDANTNNQPAGLKPSCTSGDAYVRGWLKGQLTIAASNNIFVTNSIRYVGSNSGATDANINTGIPTSNNASPPSADTTGTDVLGLSASNFVQVYHPLNSSGGNVTTSGYPLTNLEIDAAIVASNDSFLVSDWDAGPKLSALTVNGGIIQKYRGPVGTLGQSPTGYDKNYNYDTRLQSLVPPYLDDLASSAWNSISVAEGTGTG